MTLMKYNQTIIMSGDKNVFGALCTVLATAGFEAYDIQQDRTTKKLSMRVQAPIDKVNKAINLTRMVEHRANFMVTPFVGPLDPDSLFLY